MKVGQSKTNGKSLATQQSVNQTVKSICDILRRSNCKGAMQYVPELTWILFLRILDEREQTEAQEANILGRSFTPSLAESFRWHDWAATPEDSPLTARDEKMQGWKHRQLEEGRINGFIGWVNSELLPFLHNLKNQPNATPRQKVISEVISSVKQVRVDTDKNFLDVLDKVHQISESKMDTTHIFPLSQVFEGLLLKMGEKGNDGGQFFTPREVIRAMVKVVNPKIGELLTKVAELDFQAREHRAKAETIENVIYDVKAVNPNAKDTTDKRTPKKLLAFIAEKSKEVEIALSNLINLS